jgi:hypothetical protein
MNISGSDNSDRCEVVTKSWYQSAFHIQNPVSFAYANWQDDACLPPRLSNGNDTCRSGRFPSYVVEASSVEHIFKSVQFAAENNVRLVVKVLGHDLLGRYEFLEPGIIIMIVVLMSSLDLLLPRHFQFGQPVCAG